MKTGSFTTALFLSLLFLSADGPHALVESAIAQEVSPATTKVSPSTKPDVVVDFSAPLGKFKPVNGVNGGPFNYANQWISLESLHADAGFPFTRLHDVNWPHPDAVDISTIFPIFSADADDPKNYLFAKTDEYLLPIIKNKSEIIYRLGESIEWKTRHFIHPPKDYQKWAKICVNIIRHYNDGWADGFKYDIKYWEIWNEPEMKQMWSGSPKQYFQLYEVTAKAIKAYNPALKVGGPASTGALSGIMGPFLTYCRDNALPLDFCAWHIYTASPGAVIKSCHDARKLLDTYGFKDTQSWLDEWHYRPPTTRLTPKDVNDDSVREAFASTVGPESAAFVAGVMMLMQDAPIDVAAFYCADYSMYSMFSTFGVPSKTYYAFKAFYQLSQMTQRVACNWQTKDKAVTISAGLSENGKNAAVLISNSSAKGRPFTFALQNLPGQGKIHIDVYEVSKAHNLSLEQSRDISDTSDSLTFDLPASSVILVKIARP